MTPSELVKKWRENADAKCKQSVDLPSNESLPMLYEALFLKEHADELEAALAEQEKGR